MPTGTESHKVKCFLVGVQRMKKKMYVLGMVLCTFLFVVSIFQVISHYTNAQKYTEDFEKLAEMLVFCIVDI